MANLVSPGVSVTITDESYFIPAAGSTVPLFFFASADQKTQPDGTTAAAGTYEHNVIRAVTSLKHSNTLYGVPRFLEDSTGAPLHGDARNEYGLFALNQTLGIVDLAYAIRANVNLDDSIASILEMWDTKMQSSAFVLETLATAYLAEYNSTNGLIPSTAGGVATHGTVTGGTGYVTGTYTNISLTGGAGTGAKATIVVAGGAVTTVTITAPGAGYEVGDALSALNTAIGGAGTGFTTPVATLSGYQRTINKTRLLTLADTATDDVWKMFSFKNSKTSFTADATSSPLAVYADGYDDAATGTFVGLTGDALAWEGAGSGSIVPTEFTPAEAGDLLTGAADAFKYTVTFLSQTRLGANDAARRTAVVTAMAASINSNTDIRSESYEYNLVLAPGFPELADEILALIVDIEEEAFAISDTPFSMNPEDTATWGATNDRKNSRNIAYYYPHGLASNLDGKNVFIAASGIAMRTIAYSDDVSQLWFAPAGVRRGVVSGVSDVGYVSGTLGAATTFVPVALNLGQRNNLYKYPTNINPIVYFEGRGIIVWGQKTSAASASALDRINVTRMIAYIKRQLRKNTMPFVFEPNDQLTRDNLKAVVDAFLGELLVKRGLYDFATLCDESNNTPDRVDRNELYIDVALKPVKAAEFIYIPIRVVSTGAEI